MVMYNKLEYFRKITAKKSRFIFVTGGSVIASANGTARFLPQSREICPFCAQMLCACKGENIYLRNNTSTSHQPS
jgi:hypothetical protein